MDTDRRNIMRLTFHFDNNVEPVWSPGSPKIIFRHNTGNGGKSKFQQKCCLTPSGSTFLFPSRRSRYHPAQTYCMLMGTAACYPISFLRNGFSGEQWSKEPMELPTNLTSFPKVKLRKTRLRKILSRIGEILLIVLVILLLVGFMFSYVLLSLITPAGG